MNKFTLHQTPIDGLNVIERHSISDTRGLFERMFCEEVLGKFLQGKGIRQINRSLTRRKGTVRGLHFQHPPHAETKIVTCLKGKVFDVAVDLRKGSPTFLDHNMVVLTGENQRSHLIPEGFAHGFQTLTSDCELLYLHSADYAKKFEGALNISDPRLAIKWPEPIAERSERDLNHPMLTDEFQGVDLR
tara:strand:+ start:662 stop:1225 length:564 start_codon:yes stop_codon:yes gene_type:complete